MTPDLNFVIDVCHVWAAVTGYKRQCRSSVLSVLRQATHDDWLWGGMDEL